MTSPTETLAVFAGTDPRLERCFAIRRVVFIEEQAVPEHEEIDGRDRACTHFLLSSGPNDLATARLRMVEDGDHSLECRKRPLRKEGRTQDDVDAEIQFDIQRFVDAQLRPPE